MSKNDFTEKKVGKSENISATSYVIIGQITRPHGIRGEVCAQYFAESFSYLENGEALIKTAKSNPKPIYVRSWKRQGNQLVLKLTGIDSRTEAEFLRNYDIVIDKKLLSYGDSDSLQDISSANNFFLEDCQRENTDAHTITDYLTKSIDTNEEASPFLHHIIGAEICLAQTFENDENLPNYVGIVEEITFPAGQELWIIRTPKGQEVLFPAVSDFVDHFDLSDLEHVKIYINPPKGLLELYIIDEDTESATQTLSKKEKKHKEKNSCIDREEHHSSITDSKSTLQESILPKKTIADKIITEEKELEMPKSPKKTATIIPFEKNRDISNNPLFSKINSAWDNDDFLNDDFLAEFDDTDDEEFIPIAFTEEDFLDGKDFVDVSHLSRAEQENILRAKYSHLSPKKAEGKNSSQSPHQLDNKNSKESSTKSSMDSQKNTTTDFYKNMKNEVPSDVPRRKSLSSEENSSKYKAKNDNDSKRTQQKNPQDKARKPLRKSKRKPSRQAPTYLTKPE